MLFGVEIGSAVLVSPKSSKANVNRKQQIVGLIRKVEKKLWSTLNIYNPWDWYIHPHEWLIFMVNVGEYTSPMDPMGKRKHANATLSPNLSYDMMAYHHHPLSPNLYKLACVTSAKLRTECISGVFLFCYLLTIANIFPLQKGGSGFISCPVFPLQ